MLLRLFLFAIGLVVLAAAWAVEPHYVVHLSLDPATRELHARIRVSLPAGADRRFALDRGFVLQALTIDGRTWSRVGGAGRCPRAARSKSSIAPRCRAWMQPGRAGSSCHSPTRKARSCRC